MNLIIDYGNTSIKLGLFEQGQLILNSSFLPADVADLIALIKPHSFEGAILSTVTKVDSQLITFLGSLKGFMELNHETPLPFTNEYLTPATLGPDRIANMAAAMQIYSKENVLVIDAGTCLKFDFLDAKGVYSGGAISPGLAMRYKALHQFTNRLPLLIPEINIPLIGKDTSGSIHSGVINGMIAEINGIIGEYNQKFNPIHCILTGGDERYFLNMLKTRIFAAPTLTLQGLDVILRYNQ
jgi:type III pantothenate kinase